MDLIRELCSDIAAESDPARVDLLVALLRALLRDDYEQTRVRLALLAEKYTDALSKPAA